VVGVAAGVWLILARLHRPGEPPNRRDWLARAGLAAAILLAIPWAGEWTRGPPGTGPELRVATANVLGHHQPHPDLVEEVSELEADVLVIVEFTPPWKRALAGPLGSRYPHRVEHTRPDAFGLGVYSRFPLRDPEWLPGLPFDIPLLRAVVEAPGGAVPLYAVHTMPPRTLAYLRSHREIVRKLLAALDQEAGPALVVGDFNFGVNTPQHRALLRRGFRDGYADGARGHGKTWPVLGFTRVLPGMRLDHVYARGFTCIEAGLGHGHGTDHRPVWTSWVRAR
jgi:endonuclease/exonuclease/phosphatase (EEP) superfamily protein YafD